VLDEELPLVVRHVPRLRVRHARHLLEALDHIAPADKAVQRQVRGMALHAPGWFRSVTRRVCS
jgi:hypothetical protein